MIYDVVANHLPEGKTKDAIAEATIIQCDNVSRYFFETSDQDEWQLERDFPNLAPPFPVMWFEWPSPNFISADGKQVANPGPRGKFGVLWINAPKPVDGPDGWRCLLIPFTVFDGEVALNRLGDGQIAWGYSFNVKPSGEVVGNYGVLAPSYTNPDAMKVYSEAFCAFCGPALLATCFMHCRNVAMVERGPGREKKCGRNRHGPRFKYYTLDIDPMKKVLREDGQSEKTGVRRALHICRGHFAHYTDDRKLFGKFSGSFWRPMHARGRADKGTVAKDYRPGTADDGGQSE